MVFSSVAYVIFPVLLGVVLIRKYREHKWGSFKSTKSMQGKVCVITGANSGIGKEVARDLAKRKAKVILACRDLKSARNAIEEIRRNVSSGELIPMYLDLACLESVQSFARKVLTDCPEIHVLINNAGVYIPLKDKKKTEDGFEIHFGVNHLGHFLLTNLLLKRLQESQPSRIVTVSSTLHEKGAIDFANLNLDQSENKPAGRNNPGYCNSKLANVLFSQELARRLPTESGVCTYAVCPGFTLTGLFRHYPRKFYHYLLFSPIILWHLRTPAQGAQSVLYCAVSEELEGQTGGFYRDLKPYVSKADLNPGLAKELWEVSEKLVALS